VKQPEFQDARKEKIEAQEMGPVLKQVSKVLVAKGQKMLTFKPGTSDQDELMGQVIGRSGTLRAPAIRVGKTLVVGFNQEMYETLF
jgi:arsenate reductase-like glutaredoxin family protein